MRFSVLCVGSDNHEKHCCSCCYVLFNFKRGSMQSIAAVVGKLVIMFLSMLGTMLLRVRELGWCAGTVEMVNIFDADENWSTHSSTAADARRPRFPEILWWQICFGLCNDGSNTHFGTQYGSEVILCPALFFCLALPGALTPCICFTCNVSVGFSWHYLAI